MLRVVGFLGNRSHLPLWMWTTLSHPWGVSGPSHILVKHCCQIEVALWLIPRQWGAAVPLDQRLHHQVTLAALSPAWFVFQVYHALFAHFPFCPLTAWVPYLPSSLFLFYYKCCPSTTTSWRASSLWLVTLLQMQGMLGCTSLMGCNGFGALWEKRCPAPKGDSSKNYYIFCLGSGRRCLDSRSPELILLNQFTFMQWKPLSIEVSFPNLNLLTELWITVDICQFW